MIRIDDLIAKVSAYMPEGADLGQIDKAYVYSATLHRDHFSINGAPTLQHALEVSCILADMRLDLRCIVAGLLHDVLEADLADPRLLQEVVGGESARLIEELSHLSRAAFHGSEATRAEHMRQMILASTRDLRVILILLADRLHLLRDIDQLPAEQRIGLAGETMAIYAPIAHRLGIQTFKSEMEDRAFAVLEPGVYAGLEERVGARVAERQALLERVDARLDSLLEEHQYRGKVVSRIKHLYSIHRKMKNSRLDLERVHDLLATRIILDTPEDCYKVLGLVHAAFTPIPGRFKDYIALPKENGYQSLHTVVFDRDGEIIEIQIRTGEMDGRAEMGIAAHFVYKDGFSTDEVELASVNWFRKLLENLEEGRNPHESMELFTRDLNPEQVFVFTPRGEVIKLPRNATPIDFAYAVHSEVGHRCVGAKMDGKMISIRSPLKTGSVVEILTSNRQEPKKDWLRTTVSSRALGHIRAYIRKKERADAIQRGREQVVRLVKGMVKRVEDIFKLEPVASWAKRHKITSVEELFAAEGFGRIHFREVLERLFPEDTPKPANAKDQPAKKAPRRTSPAKGVVRIDGMDNMMTRFAKCCRPLHGDPLIGIITRGRGVSIHHRECRNLARQVLHEERMVEVDWAGELPSAARPVTIEILSRKSMKDLLESIRFLEDEGIPITSGRMDSKDEAITQQLTLMVEDSKRLERILQRLNAIEGVRAGRVFESE
ncbi:MAG: RelA/SpoT family protein [bacterium]